MHLSSLRTDMQMTFRKPRCIDRGLRIVADMAALAESLIGGTIADYPQSTNTNSNANKNLYKQTTLNETSDKGL